VCDNFPWQFHFFWVPSTKNNFKYFKNLTVKVCKIWCNDVYIYIRYCDIFWWKLIDRIFFNQIFNTRVVSRDVDGEGEGGLRLTLLDKFITKNSQPPSCIVKFLQILCSSCIHLILVILWLVVFDKDILSGGRGESIRSYIFFPR
jgi:hypothetical protein